MLFGSSSFLAPALPQRPQPGHRSLRLCDLPGPTACYSVALKIHAGRQHGRACAVSRRRAVLRRPKWSVALSSLTRFGDTLLPWQGHSRLPPCLATTDGSSARSKQGKRVTWKMFAQVACSTLAWVTQIPFIKPSAKLNPIVLRCLVGPARRLRQSLLCSTRLWRPCPTAATPPPPPAC